MSKLDAYFQDYSKDHRTLGNQRTHIVGIPMIVVSVLAWGSRWAWWHSSAPELPMSLIQFDLGILILGLASLWYAILDWKLAAGFFPVLLAAYFVGRSLSPELVWISFIAGWIFQFIGHGIFEKKSPAFFRSIQHLLVGPIWIFVKYSGIRK